MEPHDRPHASPSFVNVFVLLLFAAVIAFASSVGTYMYMTSRQTEEAMTNQPLVVPPPQTAIQPTTAPVNPVVTTTDETADWKTYRNDVFGFSFRYPLIFTLTDNLPLNKNNVSGPQTSLMLEDILNQTTFTLILNPEGYGRATPNKTYTTAYSGDKGIYVVQEKNSEFNPQYHDPNRIAILNENGLKINNNKIDLSFFYNKNNPTAETIFKQILSTFKFIK